MKLLKLILWALPMVASAQVVERTTTSVGAALTICDYLRQQGNVELLQDPRLEELVGKTSKIYNAASHLQVNKAGERVIVSPGYRVRVFSGNNQITSKNEAFKIEDELKFYIPDLQTYVLFKTPNWRLVVGNYRTQEEATAALRELKKKFPIYGREMFVVNDDIEIPLK
ncbi:MAG: SPOR domain-containing protein [Bacteroidales bacterium]|nr:SPOR domain-containing protein [Bacteroidales bacterium]